MEEATVQAIDLVCNIGVTVFTLVSLYFVRLKKVWGPIFGLISEPFWFGTTIINQQWGLVFLCVIYTFMWMDAAVKWHRDDKKQQEEKLCSKCKQELDAPDP